MHTVKHLAQHRYIYYQAFYPRAFMGANCKGNIRTNNNTQEPELSRFFVNSHGS